jgi:hypothetical protein
MRKGEQSTSREVEKTPDFARLDSPAYDSLPRLTLTLNDRTVRLCSAELSLPIGGVKPPLHQAARRPARAPRQQFWLTLIAWN